MLKIGEFSKLSRVTIKALRYYERIGLIVPRYVDKSNNYRYYENSQLLEIAKIISLKQIGLSVDEIKRIIVYNESMNDILKSKREEINSTINLYNCRLSKLDYLLREKDMKENIFEKIVPSYYVYYKEGVLNDYSEASNFILESGKECLRLNPNIKCVDPDYCYVNYLDGEYKKKNIKIRYAQAVIENDNSFVENENIKFMKIPETKCICIYHNGSYDELGVSYSKIMKYIDDNKLEIIDYPRECYIDGIWNKEDVNDWLTEIQIPIK